MKDKKEEVKEPTLVELKAAAYEVLVEKQRLDAIFNNIQVKIAQVTQTTVNDPTI